MIELKVNIIANVKKFSLIFDFMRLFLSKDLILFSNKDKLKVPAKFSISLKE